MSKMPKVNIVLNFPDSTLCLMLGLYVRDIYLSFTIERDIGNYLRSSPHWVDIWQLCFSLGIEGVISIDVNRGDLCLYTSKLKAFFSSAVLFAPYNSTVQDLSAAEQRLQIQNLAYHNSTKMAYGPEAMEESS